MPAATAVLPNATDADVTLQLEGDLQGCLRINSWMLLIRPLSFSGAPLRSAC